MARRRSGARRRPRCLEEGVLPERPRGLCRATNTPKRRRGCQSAATSAARRARQRRPAQAARMQCRPPQALLQSAAQRDLLRWPPRPAARPAWPARPACQVGARPAARGARVSNARENSARGRRKRDLRLFTAESRAGARLRHAPAVSRAASRARRRRLRRRAARSPARPPTTRPPSRTTAPPAAGTAAAQPPRGVSRRAPPCARPGGRGATGCAGGAASCGVQALAQRKRAAAFNRLRRGRASGRAHCATPQARRRSLHAGERSVAPVHFSAASPAPRGRDAFCCALRVCVGDARATPAAALAPGRARGPRGKEPAPLRS